MKTKPEVEEALLRAVEIAEDSDALAAARVVVAGLSVNALRFLAAAAIADHVRQVLRFQTLKAERIAERPATVTELDLKRLPSPDEGRAMANLVEAVKISMDRFAADLRMQWSAELLASTFALPDGTPVTWGAATVDQHRARVGMFVSNAQANLEGAARHQAAVNELEQSGKPTLADLVGVAA